MSDQTSAVGGASGLGYAGDVDCNEAWDILNRDALDEAVNTAQLIAEMSGHVTMAIKESINRAYEVPLTEGVRFERRLFQAGFGSADQREGMAAFVEKRQPKFRNA